MQPETYEHSQTDTPQNQPPPPLSPTHQHGSQELHCTGAGRRDGDSPGEPASLPIESDTASCTLSPSPRSISGVDESRLSPVETLSPTSDSSASDRILVDNQGTRFPPGPRFKVLKRTTKYTDDRSPLLEFPEEILLHVLSHLSASDLLTVKLVSRRFCDLVNSPHAWIDAFSRYFPGPEVLKSSVDTNGVDENRVLRRSDRPVFTRLKPRATWAGEYLARMQLLRCLARGKPGYAFVSPSTGRSGKASGITTFNSRLRLGVSHLHVNFGHPLDRRLPQFLHGVSHTGAVSSSDKNGKFDPWGTPNEPSFRHFSISYPGHAMWGHGTGQPIGIPNIMDLSASFGMVYGEGTFDGRAFFLSVDETWGRYLHSFTGLTNNRFGIPCIARDEQSTTSVWIAKTPLIPRATGGLVGILCGSSCGVVTAYSFGTSGNRDSKYDRGDITARWMISPGVPIIAISVDDCLSSERIEKNRLWAVVLNALGEVFYLDEIPTRRRQFDMNLALDFGSDVDRKEYQAWATGRSVKWILVPGTTRTPQPDPYVDLRPHTEPLNLEKSWKNLEDVDLTSWLSKTPSQIREMYLGWDMRRRLEVDFSNDDANASGESIFIVDCGIEDGRSATIKRYSRSKASEEDRLGHAIDELETQPPKAEQVSSILGPAAWSFRTDTDDEFGEAINYSNTCHSFDVTEISNDQWYCSRFSMGKSRNVTINVSALDLSRFALTSASEDTAMGINEAYFTNIADIDRSGHDTYSPFTIPGQRARMIGVGTSSGSVFLWNARAPRSFTVDSINTVKPLRVIHTDSPQITSLAISPLYVVHGGSEGLVQAWDPLASTLSPIRTLTSRSTLNTRRRTAIAAQSNPNGENIFANSIAAGAICLDPDPSVLRGVVAVGTYIRYWSFSSTAANGDLSKSQKRRLRRSDRGFTSPAADHTGGVRRVGLKGIIAEEALERQLEEKERKHSEQEDRRIAARFGLDLFGAETSEEQLIAYAEMVSAEDYERRLSNVDEITDDEYSEKWKYASWEERFEMSASSSTTRAPTSTSPTPVREQVQREDTFAKALRLSLEARNPAETPWAERQASSPPEDEDLARAIQASLTETTDSSPKMPGPSSPSIDPDEALAKALSISLAEAQESSPSPASLSTFGRSRQISLTNFIDEEFPVLGSTPPSTGSTLRRAGDKGKGRAL